MSDINKKLKDMYLENVKELNIFMEQNLSKNPHGPLLLSVDKYLQQKTKVMIIGQETNGWSKSLSVIEQIETYTMFNLGEKYKYRRSPFWNVIRKIELALGIEPYSIAWSNLNRFDINKKPPDKVSLESITSFDNILKNEIEILQPDVCIFFSGHKKDSRIKKLYQDVQFENIEELNKTQFSRLNHAELPQFSIRAPHPRFMRMKKMENNFIKYIAKNR